MALPLAPLHRPPRRGKKRGEILREVEVEGVEAELGMGGTDEFQIDKRMVYPGL